MQNDGWLCVRPSVSMTAACYLCARTCCCARTRIRIKTTTKKEKRRALTRERRQKILIGKKKKCSAKVKFEKKKNIHVILDLFLLFIFGFETVVALPVYMYLCCSNYMLLNQPTKKKYSIWLAVNVHDGVCVCVHALWPAKLVIWIFCLQYKSCLFCLLFWLLPNFEWHTMQGAYRTSIFGCALEHFLKWPNFWSILHHFTWTSTRK